MRSFLLAGVVAAATATAARAEPVTVGGQTWQHDTSGGFDRFTRADGAVVEARLSPTACPALGRTASAPRPAWVPVAYWPQVDTAAGGLTLCLQRLTGAATVVVPARGGGVPTDVAPLLARLADELRPPTEVEGLGPIQASWPIAMSRGEAISFAAGDDVVGVGIHVEPRGSCAYEHALVAVKVGEGRDAPFADGWWPTTFASDKATYGCLDLRDGYATVFVSPPDRLSAIADVLATLRAAAYARHGAPVTSAAAIALPHAGRTVAPMGRGLWKLIDGEALKQPGADALVAIAALGGDSTMFAVVVTPGPCAPGATGADAATAAALFPAALGPVWLDDDPYKIRWQAWACVAAGDAAARLAVLGPYGSAAPTDHDLPLVRAAIDAVAAAYGVAIAPPPAPVPEAPSPSSARDRGRPLGMADFYGGVVALVPAAGDRQWGGVVGLDLRLRQAGTGFALAADIEIGRAGGAWQGELRTGAGFGLGPLEAVGGISFGSTGPAAPMDLYGQVGLTLGTGRRRLWLGGLYAVGVGGPDHQRLDATLIAVGARETGVFVGGRLLRFADGTDDSGAPIANGTAVIVTIGTGAASAR